MQSHVNNIEFDFVDYARQRLQQYQLLKAKLKIESTYSPCEKDWDFTIDFISQPDANMHYDCQIIEW